MLIRLAHPDDHAGIWDVIIAPIRSGHVFALPQDMTREAALAYWLAPSHEVFVAEENGTILGTYYIQPNQQGGGSHVANCGYATGKAAVGKGIGQAMCQHSLDHAKRQGFRAMQFNFVVSTNERAVNLWLSFGFQIVGRLPCAFRHPELGFVDALVMFRNL